MRRRASDSESADTRLSRRACQQENMLRTETKTLLSPRLFIYHGGASFHEWAYVEVYLSYIGRIHFQIFEGAKRTRIEASH